MTAKELYDQDIFLWTVRNAELLRAGRLEEADLEHIAEEIEDMGSSQERTLSSRLHVLVTHLLKMQAERQSRARNGWMATVDTQRYHIRRLLKRAPSLKNQVAEEITEGYRVAVGEAAAGTELPKSSFPKTCPFTVEQILDEEFFPE
jgi:uncharacterized protein DUF29